MSREIKNVALAGASGNVGSQVLSALLDVKFNVTILSRNSKSFPAGAQVKVVDFTSVPSLAAALVGQDAVIDTTFSPEIETPLRLIDAAVESGVYRFITSDFGLDPDLPGVHDLPVFGRKKASYEAVKKHAAHNDLTYTLITCGAFLDWSLSTGFSGLNLQEKKAFIFGDGDNVVPWSTLKDVGKATANALLHPQETRNRPVYVHSVYLSQNQLLNAAREVVGADGWEITYNDMEPLLEQALADLRSGNISAATFEVQIQYCLATARLAHPWVKDDNSLVGLTDWSLDEVKELIRTIASKAV